MEKRPILKLAKVFESGRLNALIRKPFQEWFTIFSRTKDGMIQPFEPPGSPLKAQPQSAAELVGIEIGPAQLPLVVQGH